MRRVALVLLLGACKGNGDEKGDTPADDTDSGGLGGFYEVSKQFYNDGSCSDRGQQEEFPVPVVRLEERSGGIDVTMCNGVDDCPGSADGEWRLEPDGDGWLGQTNGGDFSPQQVACHFVLLERTMKVEGADITLDRRLYELYDYEITSDVQCQEELPGWQGAQGECTVRETIIATKAQ